MMNLLYETGLWCQIGSIHPRRHYTLLDRMGQSCLVVKWHKQEDKRILLRTFTTTCFVFTRQTDTAEANKEYNIILTIEPKRKQTNFSQTQEVICKKKKNLIWSFSGEPMKTSCKTEKPSKKQVGGACENHNSLTWVRTKHSLCLMLRWCLPSLTKRSL